MCRPWTSHSSCAAPKARYRKNGLSMACTFRYLRNQNVQAMDKPFFLYLAFGAAHAPHQVPASYIDKYVPVFEKGWDKTRDERLARQKQLGIAPRDTELTPRNPGIKSWDSLTADEKRLFVRFQAAYAGFVEHT